MAMAAAWVVELFQVCAVPPKFLVVRRMVAATMTSRFEEGVPGFEP